MQNETRRAKLEEEIERVGGSQTSGAAQAAQKGGQTA
jgi:hypothetical protein